MGAIKKVNTISRREKKAPYESGVVRFVDHSLSIAKQINIYLAKHGKNQLWLAKELNKSEAEISKWLQGSHNFTIKTISKIEDALNEKIILCQREIQKNEYRVLVFQGSASNSFFVKPKSETSSEKDYTFSAPVGKSVIREECLLTEQ